jgi:cation transport regulator
MPYGSISELPKSVRDSLPKHGQEIFLAALNSAIEQGKDEETGFKIAWGAVGKSYEKVDGEWKKAGNLISIPELINKEHDVILERLNQTLHYQDHGDIFYSPQPFQDSINNWNGIPIIFANDHPDFLAFDENPEQELKRINGAIVGKITSPQVQLAGTSRVVAKFQIENLVIENLIKSSKLAHSPAFRFKADAKNNLTYVSPHHVLVFIQDALNKPRDAGAMILNKIEATEMANKDPTKEDMDSMLDFMKANPGMMDKATMDKMYTAMDGANQKEYMKGVLKDLQSHPEMMDDEMKNMMKGMKNKDREQETIDTMGKEDELSKQLEISNKEKETLTGTIEGLEKEIANKNEQLKVFAQKEADRLKIESDARWQEIKNKLPVGLTHKEEDVANLRKDWESNKDAFYMKHFVNAEHIVLPGEEGKTIANKELDAKTKAGFTVGGVYTTEV